MRRRELEIIQDLLSMVRLPILVGGVAGCCLGALLGLNEGGVFDTLQFTACYLAVGLGDLSTHFSNSYYDVELDRLAAPKTFGVINPLIKKVELLPLTMRFATLLSALSIFFALVSVVVGVSPIMLLLALSVNILGWMYSRPPYRLVSHGLGEVAISFVTGFVVPGAGYLATRGLLDDKFLHYSGPLILLGLVLSLSLELPDIEADRSGGKMNIVARLGWRSSLRIALLLCFVSTLMFNVYYGLYSTLASLIPLSTFFLGNMFGSEDRGRLDIISTGCVLSLFLYMLVMLGILSLGFI